MVFQAGTTAYWQGSTLCCVNHGGGSRLRADYEKLKKAILIRYDINEESYRKQFRTARKADSETNRELKARLDNLAAKWLNECATAADVRDKVVMEQGSHGTTHRYITT